MLRVVNEPCRVPACENLASAGLWREPFSRFRWGVNLAITVEDLAFDWPLCAEHADALSEAALDAVGETLNGWGLDPGHKGLEER